MENFKKAAMFGLDARIALAIFGALSVISGAALFSAIQESKVASFVTKLEEISKAWEAYYLDVGSELPTNSTDSTNSHYYLYQSARLVDNADNAIGWNGPYLPYTANSYWLDDDTYERINFNRLDNAGTHGGSNSWSYAYCTSGKSCHLSVYMDGLDSLDFLKNLDAYIDDSDGDSAGRFRWYYVADTYKYRIHYRTIPVRNPHD